MTPVSFLGGKVILYPGDCRNILKQLDDNSVDSICCDPPYHLQSIVKRFGGQNAAPAKHGTDGAFKRASSGFMSKTWDGGDIAFRPELWAEVLRVLKPGGYIMAFSSCRTYHRMACAIEDAGFITHPFFAWAFGSGFPKAHSVSKQIDRARNAGLSDDLRCTRWINSRCKELGLTAKDLGGASCTATMAGHWMALNAQPAVPTLEQWQKIEPLLGTPPDWMLPLLLPAFKPGEAWELREKIGEYETDMGGLGGERLGKPNGDITANATDAAREWDGWFYGTQACKPALEPVYFGQKPFERGLNGAQNVLEWGVGAINVAACKVGTEDRFNPYRGTPSDGWGFKAIDGGNDTTGRWPSNLLLSPDDEVLACFPESGQPTGRPNCVGREYEPKREIYGKYGANTHDSCFLDSGSSARFFASFPQDDVKRIFYTSKADADDRLGSKHPTVKPLSLIQYLVRLITPKNGVCLDLFAGTGTTAEACFREGFRCTLIEREDEYIEDIERRMSLVMEGPDTRAYASMKARNRPRDDGPLFGGSDEPQTFRNVAAGFEGEERRKREAAE